MKPILLFCAGLSLPCFALFAGCGLDAEGRKSDFGTGTSGTTGNTSSTSGSSGSGGSGGSLDCKAGEVSPCYEGPAGTEGIGVCSAGIQTCGSDGQFSGDCMGQVLPAPADNCVSSIDANCDGALSPCTGKSLWGFSFGSNAIDIGYGTAVDSQQNMIVAGFLGGDADIGGISYKSKGADDIVIIKLSPMGQPIWTKTFGGNYIDKAYDVAVDASDNIWITGSFSTTIDLGFGPFVSAGALDIFLLKLSPEGTPQLARRFGGTADDRGFAIATGPDSVVITGSFYNTLSFDSGAPSFTAQGEDIYVASFELDGAYRWSQAYGDPSPQTAWDLSINESGHIFVTGDMYGTVDFGGGELKADGDDALVFSLDAAGQHRYSKLFGGSNIQTGWGISADKDGNAYVGGEFTTTLEADKTLSAVGTDAFVLRLDPAGEPQWSFQLANETGDKRIYAVRLDPFGNLLFTGAYWGKGTWKGAELTTATRDIMIGKLSPAGEGIWLKLFGDDSGYDQRGWGIATDAQANVYAVGSFDYSITFEEGGVGTKAVGSMDGFALKLEP